MKSKKKLLWGISGSIAIYKIPNVINQLKDIYDIYIVLTKSAKKFINPITFESIVGKKVFSKTFENPMLHIDLVKDLDIFIIAPATYNIIGKIASGVADDLLTNVSALVSSQNHITKILAPAMNTNMFKNPLFYKNLRKLKKYNNYKILKPDYGRLACGTIGIGKMKSAEKIIKYFSCLEKKRRFVNKKILITGGSTIEKIDPMRYISNFSSGKMAIELCRSFKKEGAFIELIHGRISSFLPLDIKSSYAESTDDFLKVLKEKINQFDILIMCAAISDYKVLEYSKEKKAKKDSLSLDLIKTPDILKTLSPLKKKNQIFIGFSAGTGNISDQIKIARKKLYDKKLNMIIHNPIDKKGIAINSNDNEIYILLKDKENFIYKSKKSKKKISRDIIDVVYQSFFQDL